MRDRTWAWGLFVLFWVGSVAMPAAASQQDSSIPTDLKKEAASRPREAWKWTLEERLAARFDPAAMAEREAEHEAELETIRQRFGGRLPLEDEAKMTGPPAVTEHIDGSKTPELFLPSELFTLLIIRGFSQGENRDIRKSREPIEERAAALGFGSDLWVRLEKAATPYLRLLRGGGPHEGDESEQEKRDIRLCRQRARALKAAKAEFGEESFLRLLYEALAPTARPTYLLSGRAYDKYAENLRKSEEGCQ